jgi:predicted RNA binding protein YcfA (HicA-like mRNA interferase family)
MIHNPPATAAGRASHALGSVRPARTRPKPAGVEPCQAARRRQPPSGAVCDIMAVTMASKCASGSLQAAITYLPTASGAGRGGRPAGRRQLKRTSTPPRQAGWLTRAGPFGTRLYDAYMDSRAIIRALEAAGWTRVAQRGSHVQFKHLERSGRVTVPHPCGMFRLARCGASRSSPA